MLKLKCVSVCVCVCLQMWLRRGGVRNTPRGGTPQSLRISGRDGHSALFYRTARFCPFRHYFWQETHAVDAVRLTCLQWFSNTMRQVSGSAVQGPEGAALRPGRLPGPRGFSLLSQLIAGPRREAGRTSRATERSREGEERGKEGGRWERISRRRGQNAPSLPVGVHLGRGRRRRRRFRVRVTPSALSSGLEPAPLHRRWGTSGTSLAAWNNHKTHRRVHNLSNLRKVPNYRDGLVPLSKFILLQYLFVCPLVWLSRCDVML